MKIVLNAELQPVAVNEHTAQTRAERRAGGYKEFAEQFIRKLHNVAAPVDPTQRWSPLNAQVVRGIGDHDLVQTGFAKAVSEAYSTHKGLVLHPHDIWYVVLANITAIVSEKPDNYRGFYTSSDEKQLLLVEQNHATDIDVGALIAKLGELMPVDVSVFLPELSTATPEANLAMSAAVLDAAQHYYDYGMFCCGIPFIDLRGTAEDWMKLRESCDAIREIGQNMGPQTTKLTNYMTGVHRVLVDIALSFYEDQTEFWKDIFTQKNVGSGGDLVITGWICDLYHGIKRGDMIKSFHDGISQVPYKNVSTGQHFMMFHGAFGCKDADGALEIAYDHVTIEYKPKDDK